MSSTKGLKKELRDAAKVVDLAERGIAIACVVAEALRSVGQDPILVGGAAVEFYTKGGYSTSDIDMVTPGGADLARTMADLGFEKIGKDYADPVNKIYIEFPGTTLGPTERFVQLQVGQKRLRIISPEDLIVDRLCAFKFWKSGIDGVNAMLLAEMTDYNKARMQARAREEEVLDAWDGVKSVREAAIREKLSREAASALLEKLIRKLKR